MKSDLFIRADGSTDIGLGHLVRCISLSSFLTDLFSITFVCREVPHQIENELDQSEINLLRINKEQDFFINLTPGAVVVLDGYLFNTAYQKKIKETGSVLVCIDDLHDKEFYADLIINHAPGIRESDYSAQPTTQFALGLDYALLRPAFLKAALSRSIKKKNAADNILICFGGSDSENLTVRALNVISDFNRFKKIIIITGSAYSYRDELLRNIKNKEKILYHHALDGDEMAEAFSGSDVAVVPASGILFEALATGNIAISGMYTSNQKEVYSGFKKLNAIIDAGTFSEQELKAAIQQIGSKKDQQQLIDGRSPERLRSLFKSLKSAK